MNIGFDSGTEFLTLMVAVAYDESGHAVYSLYDDSLFIITQDSQRWASDGAIAVLLENASDLVEASLSQQ